jgi:hypothetical protein
LGYLHSGTTGSFHLFHFSKREFKLLAARTNVKGADYVNLQKLDGVRESGR